MVNFGDGLEVYSYIIEVADFLSGQSLRRRTQNSSALSHQRFHLKLVNSYVFVVAVYESDILIINFKGYEGGI